MARIVTTKQTNFASPARGVPLSPNPVTMASSWASGVRCSPQEVGMLHCMPGHDDRSVK